MVVNDYLKSDYIMIVGDAVLLFITIITLILIMQLLSIRLPSGYLT